MAKAAKKICRVQERNYS